MRTSFGVLPARICFGDLACFHWKSRCDIVICVLNRPYVPGADDCVRSISINHDSGEKENSQGRRRTTRYAQEPAWITYR